MSDDKKFDIKEIEKKILASPFFTFSEKPIDFFEKDKIFKIIYMLICIAMAAITIFHPLRVLVQMIISGYFSYGARFGIRYLLTFIFIWVSIAASCWLGFHMWWKRREKAATLFGSSEFVVLPFFSEIIRTVGEWFGILFAGIGLIGGLFSQLLLGKNAGSAIQAVLDIGGEFLEVLEGIPFAGGFFTGLINFAMDFAVILGPVAGIVIILITRFIAENIRVFSAIANNTKKDFR